MPFFSGHLELAKEQTYRHFEKNPKLYFNAHPTDLDLCRQVLEREGVSKAEMKRCLKLLAEGKEVKFPRDQDLDEFKPFNYSIDSIYDEYSPGLASIYHLFHLWEEYVNFPTPRTNYRQDVQRFIKSMFPTEISSNDIKDRNFYQIKLKKNWESGFDIAKVEPNEYFGMHYANCIYTSEQPVLDPYYNLKLYILKKYARYRKIIFIQRQWRERFYNPESEICRRWTDRVQKTFDKNKN